jgi:hypothetical protein
MVCFLDRCNGSCRRSRTDAGGCAVPAAPTFDEDGYGLGKAARVGDDAAASSPPPQRNAMLRVLSFSLFTTAIAMAQCPSANTTCTTPWNGGNGNTFALILTTGPSAAETIFGFDLLTRYTGTAGSVTTTIEVYLADSAGLPQIPAARTGSMTITTPYQFHSGVLTTPITVPANTRYFIAFAEAQMSHPICQAGGTPTSYYWHPPNATTWNGTFTQAWTYRVSCAPGYAGYGAGCRGSNQQVPSLTNTGLPRLNQQFTVDLSQAVPSRPAFLFFGLSRTQWLTLRLPFDLTPIGAPCMVLSSGEIQFPTAVGATGNASVRFSVPNNMSLIGAPFFNQYWITDPGNNPLNLSASNGGAGVIGQ